MSAILISKALVQVWRVLTRNHTVLPATHTSIHECNEPFCIPSRRASPHFSRYLFPIPLRVGG